MEAIITLGLGIIVLIVITWIISFPISLIQWKRVNQNLKYKCCYLSVRHDNELFLITDVAMIFMTIIILAAFIGSLIMNLIK